MNLAYVNLASVLRDVSPASTKTFYTSLRSDVFDVLSFSTLSDTDKAALGRCFDALPDPDTIGHADVAFFEDVLTRFSANMTSAKLAESFVVRVNDRNGLVELPAEALAWTDPNGNLVARPPLAPDVSVASGEAVAAAPEGRKRKAPPPVRIVLDDEAADGDDDDDDSDDESSSSSSGDVDDDSSSDSPLEFAEATVGKKFVEKLSEPKFNIPRSLADDITDEWRERKAHRTNIAPGTKKRKKQQAFLLSSASDICPFPAVTPLVGRAAQHAELVTLSCSVRDLIYLRLLERRLLEATDDARVRWFGSVALAEVAAHEVTAGLDALLFDKMRALNNARLRTSVSTPVADVLTVQQDKRHSFNDVLLQKQLKAAEKAVERSNRATQAAKAAAKAPVERSLVSSTSQSSGKKAARTSKTRRAPRAKPGEVGRLREPRTNEWLGDQEEDDDEIVGYHSSSRSDRGRGHNSGRGSRGSRGGRGSNRSRRW
jgi:hypothetical protein